MKNIKLNRLIRIGQLLRYIEDYSEGFYRTWVKGERGTKIGLIDSLIKVKETIDELDISKKTSEEIQQYISKIEKKYKPGSDLSGEDKKLLKERIKLWYDRIINESEELNVILLNSKYTLNHELLINGAKDFFKDSVWKKLTKSTQADLNECCKCLLFELPTPGGFLALRATESVLRRYYKRKTGRVINGHIDWKAILNQLKSTNVDDTLLGHLDYLRNNLRNKLSHPDAFLTQKEAENIFPMIVISIESLIKDF